MVHNRRGLLRAAIVALALPAFATLPGTARSQSGTFAPPEGPMLYTRRLERGMAGDAAFTVSRSFTIRFSKVPGGGYRVDGEQVAVAVDAPQSLAPFVEMERARRERALFPLLLDSAGLIDGNAEAVPPPQLGEAVREALARIERLALAQPAKAELRAFVQSVHQNAAELITQLPRDLFAPGVKHDVTQRSLVLPGGAEGTVTIAYSAESDPATGLMRSAEREVRTEFSGSRRRTLESWTLVPQQ